MCSSQGCVLNRTLCINNLSIHNMVKAVYNRLTRVCRALGRESPSGAAYHIRLLGSECHSLILEFACVITHLF
jgi:hypothetical protein